MRNPASINGTGRRKLRVLLAEQSPAVRQRLRKTLDELFSVETVGEAGGDNEALELSFRLQPEVVVLSASLPDQGGFEVLRRIKRTLANCDVILMSYRPCAFVQKAASLLGATAVCPMEDGFTQLCDLLSSRTRNREAEQTAKYAGPD
jgi:DNA-binding NarL/FixJ family response regulator